MNNQNKKPIQKPNKKQTTQFIVTNNYTGTKSLSDILAKIALTEINNSADTNQKPKHN